MNQTTAHYEEPIKKLMEKMDLIRFSNPDSLIEYCQELLSIADNKKDSYLEAYAYYYLSDAYLSLGRISESIHTVQKGIVLQEQNQYHQLLSQSYNLIAIDYYSQGDVLLALDNFYLGLQIALTTGDQSAEAKFYNNIASIYFDHEDYDQAIYYCEKSLTLATQLNDADSMKQHHARLFLNFAYCYFGKGEFDKALSYLNQISDTLPEEDTERHFLCTRYIHTNILYHTGQLDASRDIAVSLASLATEKLAKMEYFQEMVKLTDLLLNLKEYEASKSLLDKLSEILKAESCETNLLSLHRAYINYYEVTHNEEEKLKWLQEYYVHRKQWLEESKQTIITAIDNRLDLEEETAATLLLKENTKELSIRSTCDELTGLGNRHGLGNYNLINFSLAKAKGLAYGTILIDIDNLKKYNDTLGHLEGDECIRTIADCINTALPESSHYYAARYGGDEFVIASFDRSTDELEELARQIQNNVRKQQLRFQYNGMPTQISLTMGIANQVPEEQHTATDFIHAADAALYTIKHSTKNGYGITKTV